MIVLTKSFMIPQSLLLAITLLLGFKRMKVLLLQETDLELHIWNNSLTFNGMSFKPTMTTGLESALPDAQRPMKESRRLDKKPLQDKS